MIAREGQRAVADEEDVAAVVEDPSREPDGAPDAAHGAHRAGLERVAFHDGRVALHRSPLRQGRAVAGVQARVVFHGLDGGLDRVQRRAAAAEDRPSSREGLAQGLPVRRLVVGVAARPPVDDERRHHQGLPSLRVNERSGAAGEASRRIESGMLGIGSSAPPIVRAEQRANAAQSIMTPDGAA